MHFHFTTCDTFSYIRYLFGRKVEEAVHSLRSSDECTFSVDRLAQPHYENLNRQGNLSEHGELDDKGKTRILVLPNRETARIDSIRLGSLKHYKNSSGRITRGTT